MNPNEASMPTIQGLRVVWTAQLSESEWLHYLLSPFQPEHVYSFDDTLDGAMPDTIYVISSNSRPLSTVDRRFFADLHNRGRLGLLHASDEWFSEDYRFYEYFDFVLRTYHAKAFNRYDGVLTVPLGWPNSTPTNASTPRASSRHYRWSFAGNLIGSRGAMYRAMRGLGPHRCFLYGHEGTDARPPLTAEQYRELLEDTSFCPAPMGNVMTETWRLYEGLEAGCIPLVERHFAIDYYRELFGPHPIPTFNRWKDARDYAEEISAQSATLDMLQSEIQEWWRAYKSSTRQHVTDFIQERLSRPRPVRVAGPSSSRHALVRRAWQLTELAKHHSPEAFGRRLLKTGGRMMGRVRSGVERAHGESSNTRS